MLKIGSKVLLTKNTMVSVDGFPLPIPTKDQVGTIVSANINNENWLVRFEDEFIKAYELGLNDGNGLAVTPQESNCALWYRPYELVEVS